MDGSVPVEHRSKAEDKSKKQRYANANSYGIVGSTTSSRAKSFRLKIFTVIVLLLALCGKGEREGLSST